LRRILLYAVYAIMAAAAAGLGTYLAVSFVVERGPEVSVPRVAGLRLAQALDALDAARLDLEVGEFEYSERVPEDQVIRQKPEAGRVVKGGRGVRVIVSRGPERRAVPDLAGLGLEDARIALAEAGLVAEPVGRVPGGPEGQVVAQGVSPGGRRLKGAAVPLLVSSGPRPVLLRMPALQGLTRGSAVVALDRLGVRIERLEEARDDPDRRGLVVAQAPEAGSPVVRGAGVVLTVVPEREEPAEGAPLKRQPKGEP
jgi:serine/threonine-protein kinase